MPRPLPIIPRAARHRRTAAPTVLLACPVVSPQWELAAYQALIKPQLKGSIIHRKAEQHLPPDAEERIRRIRRAFVERLGPPIFDLNFPAAGDYRVVAEVPREQRDLGRALALAMSSDLSGIWWVIDRLYVCDGRFYRRRFGYKLNLSVAADVHLPRPLRQVLRGLLPCNGSRRPSAFPPASAAR